MKARANTLGIDTFDLMVVTPDRLADKTDGPCHSSEFRKRFWTDVLKSLELSYALLFDKARQFNEERKRDGYEECIPDLEERIARIAAEVSD